MEEIIAKQWKRIKNLFTSSKPFRYLVYIGLSLVFILSMLFVTGIPTRYKLKSYAKNGEIQKLIDHITKNIDFQTNRIKSGSVYLTIDLIVERKDSKGLEYLEELYYRVEDYSFKNRIITAFCNNNLSFRDIQKLCDTFTTGNVLMLLPMIRLYDDAEALYHAFCRAIADRINALKLDDALWYARLYVANVNSEYIKDMEKLNDNIALLRSIRNEKDISTVWKRVLSEINKTNLTNKAKETLQQISDFYFNYNKDIASAIATYDTELAERMINYYVSCITAIDSGIKIINSNVEAIVKNTSEHKTQLEMIDLCEKEIRSYDAEIEEIYTISGYIIARISERPERYEISLGGLYSVLGYSDHVILETVETAFRTTGNFALRVKRVGTQSVTLKSGFSADWVVLREVPSRTADALNSGRESSRQSLRQHRAIADKLSSETKKLKEEVDSLLGKYADLWKNGLIRKYFEASPVDLPPKPEHKEEHDDN